MTEGNYKSRIIRFAIPIFIGYLFQQLYSTVDSLIVGNFVGSEALAAVSATASLIYLMLGFFMGFCTGAGVIVARAAQGNPWIFNEIRAALRGEPWTPPTPAERVEMALKHFDLESKLHGEKRGLLEMRKHIAWYVAGLNGASKFRERINTMPGAEDVKQALREFGKSAEELL